MMTLTVIVSILAFAVLMLAGANVKQTARLNRHHEVMERNLDLIESLNRSGVVSENAWKGFTLCEVKDLEEKHRVMKKDYRGLLEDQLIMAKLLHTLVDDLEGMEALLGGYFVHVGVEPDVAPEHGVFNSVDTK